MLKAEDLGGCKMSKPFYLAIEAKFREFISDDAFDDLLGKIWSDGIVKYDKYKYVPVSFSSQYENIINSMYKYMYIVHSNAFGME